MKKVLSIFKSIFQGLSILLGFAAIILIIIPLIAGIRPYIVLSGSMEPGIQTGSIAYVNTHVPVQDIHVGDIIGFKVVDKQVTHRVVSINADERSFVTKGDKNETEDAAPVLFENYQGKTEFSIPYLGRAIEFLKTSTGMFVVSMLVGINLILIIFEGAFEKKEDSKDNVENKKDGKDEENEKK